MNYRTDYSCNKCNIQYSPHKDRVYHNRLEHMKTKCIKCDQDIYGENNKQIHERKCTKDKRPAKTIKTDSRKNTTKTSELKNYNIFTVLDNKEPVQENKKDKRTTNQKIRSKGKKIAKPKGTCHQTAKKLHQRVADHFKKTTKEERMQECARNGEMHSNKIREIIRKRYNVKV